MTNELDTAEEIAEEHDERANVELLKTNVLETVERRLSDSIGQAQSDTQAIIDAMRDEIGREHHERANVELPKLEEFIEQEMRPWLARITRLLVKADNPLPPEQQRYLQEMQTTCDTVPRIIRQGLAGWDHLMPPVSQDGRSMDPYMRRELVAGVRFCLTNWNGRQSRLETLRASIEEFLTLSNWPFRRTA